jgi:hypothetical protein
MGEAWAHRKASKSRWIGPIASIWLLISFSKAAFFFGPPPRGGGLNGREEAFVEFAPMFPFATEVRPCPILQAVQQIPRNFGSNSVRRARRSDSPKCAKAPAARGGESTMARRIRFARSPGETPVHWAASVRAASSSGGGRRGPLSTRKQILKARPPGQKPLVVIQCHRHAGPTGHGEQGALPTGPGPHPGQIYGQGRPRQHQTDPSGQAQGPSGGAGTERGGFGARQKTFGNFGHARGLFRGGGDQGAGGPKTWALVLGFHVECRVGHPAFSRWVSIPPPWKPPVTSTAAGTGIFSKRR